ncbi:SURF1 family protein [Sinorhizobium medicae]|uniref:SURF1 family protein n=1 Tax=Sinorhizobium medicae TaxID=110321 RepID=UPI0003670FD0|nr:SURF1 family protein [Sinorhizobium medicae]MBO1939440.1 SURF1 family protein [Sinorhizobium medicae]MBO1963332.1 SURF1 family protein [Sinorhizobium medicae]MDX0957179.1 SURF1 family protein [Sinorhizobium medicae]TWA27540.1 surfeit locus 1 family protein [Sinorhizobium medicae]TWA35274.1 surfeit locus 1 family protein [Sinorhizobium medicae]
MRAPVKSTVADGHMPAFRRLFGRVAGVVLVLAALAVLVALGTWQMQRLQWKEALIGAIAERRSAPAVPLEQIEAMAAAGGDIDYRTVHASGIYDHGRERHFFATHEGRTGFYVFTPLMLADARALFVNRGFVPFEKKDSSKRSEGLVAGKVTVNGLARPKLSGKPSSLVPDNDPAKNIFYWKDLGAMANSTGISSDRVVPFFIDADAAPNPGGLPVGGVTQFDLPNNHLQYALTWYGLAAALVAVSGVFVYRRRR